VTTKSRLNALLAGLGNGTIYAKDRKWYIAREVGTTEAWTGSVIIDI
jgi:hypothetical protein